MVRRSQDEERDNNNDLLIGVAGAAALFGAAYLLFSGKSEEKPKTLMEEAHYATAQGGFDVLHGEEKLKRFVTMNFLLERPSCCSRPHWKGRFSLSLQRC